MANNPQAKKKSKYTVKIIGTGFQPDQPPVANVLVLEGPKPLPDVYVTFEVSGRTPSGDFNNTIPGEFITDPDGMTQVFYDIPEDATEVKTKAIAALEGKPYDEQRPINLATAYAGTERKEVEILHESLDLGNGEWQYYIALLDFRTKFPTTGSIAVMIPDKRLEITDVDNPPSEIKRRNFTITFSQPRGRMFYFKALDPGMYEMDWMPENSPLHKRQTHIAGPKEGPIKGGDSFWEELFEGGF